MTETGECRPLRVVFLSSSDDLGGAAIVTRRLMHALVGEGVDAKMIAFNKITDDPLVESAKKGRQRRGFSFVAERTKIFLKNGLSYKNLFKVSTASNGIRLDKKELVRDADIIVLSWINQGLLSLEGIKQL
ncbi:MAG: glycosyl transferase family 1, partial [Paramuribaculum sp.]|nr:glycosyl transferase family 1 [Paramuribaculum sp.]